LCLTKPLAGHTLQPRGIWQRLNDMTKARTNSVRNAELLKSGFFKI
jgi:hypothetical protein